MADGDVEAAAEHLAKVAVHVRRRGPMVKRADVLDELGSYLSRGYGAVQDAVKPYVRNDAARNALINGLIGAGVGGAGMGALGAASGKGKRRVLNSALAGALMGGAVGSGGTAIANMAPELTKGVSTSEELAKNWEEKPLVGKALSRAFGGAPEGTSMLGDVGGAVAAQPLTSLATAGAPAAVLGAHGYRTRQANRLYNFIEGVERAQNAAPGHSLHEALRNPTVQDFRNKLYEVEDPLRGAKPLGLMRAMNKAVKNPLRRPGASAAPGAARQAFNELMQAGARPEPSHLNPMGLRRPRFLTPGLGTALAGATLLPSVVSALTGGSRSR